MPAKNDRNFLFLASPLELNTTEKSNVREGIP